MGKHFSRRNFLHSAALSGLAIATTDKWKLTGIDEALAAAVDEGLTQYVDVFIGTGGHGHTYPGATRPFGMVQLSPDTWNGDWDHCSGYHISDTSIMGFSHTHLSGTGASDLLDILLMPSAGAVKTEPGTREHPETGYRSKFSHATEKAEPGYYTVVLADHGIKAELTATERVGLHRYTFPADPTSHFIVDLEHGVIDPPRRMNTNVMSSEVHIAGNDLVTGGRRTAEWAPGRYIYFAMKFSRPFTSAQIVSGTEKLNRGVKEATGKSLKCVLSCPTKANEVIQVKVALSAVSIEGALKNLEAEAPGWDFDGTRKAAKAAWERELGKIEVEMPTLDQKKIFYTAMYHSFVAPTLFSDVDGRYRGMDLEVHQLPAGELNYSTFSLWDTYRALHPLFTLVQTERLPGMLNTMIRMAEQSPAGVPVWPLQAVETACMIGYHSAPVLAEAYVKGIPGVDYAKAYTLWRKRAMQDDYRGMGYYRKLGYIPCDKDEESVSKTIEYSYDDWAMANLAKAAGAREDEKLYRARCRNYQNVFDRDLTFMRGRLADGAWAKPFDPRAMGYSKQWRDFTESNSWQATFVNQHDLAYYMQLFGGDAGFVKKLDELFTTSSELPADAPPDIAGLVGQYAHGNEPCHHVAYLYAYAGMPYKTQARVAMLLESMHHNDPDGLAGNEDCGQMSAWYVLSALGFYAVDPVSGNYVFGTPLVSRAKIHLGNGKTLEIESNGSGTKTPYIQTVKWNGQEYRKSWFRHGEIQDGGKFEFGLGAEANKGFGEKEGERPPSLV